MTPQQQAWAGYDRLKGSRTTNTSWTDNALELSRLLQRIGRTLDPIPAVDLNHDIDQAIHVVNEMRAGLNTISDALTQLRPTEAAA